MKKRTGFVSNSSSSSFLLGVGVIEDEEKFNNWWNSINEGIDKYFWQISIIEKLINGEDFILDSDIRPEGCLELCSFRGDVLRLPLNDTKLDDKIFVLNIENNEGDEYFLRSNECCIDYNIDVEFLGSKQEKIYKDLDSRNDIGLERTKVIFGAGRNG